MHEKRASRAQKLTNELINNREARWLPLTIAQFKLYKRNTGEGYEVNIVSFSVYCPY